MRDDESLGVPRPDTMKMIFFLSGSHVCNHLGISTATRGKKTLSMTQPLPGAAAEEEVDDEEEG
jgi:hypothetical protein